MKYLNVKIIFRFAACILLFLTLSAKATAQPALLSSAYTESRPALITSDRQQQFEPFAQSPFSETPQVFADEVLRQKKSQHYAYYGSQAQEAQVNVDGKKGYKSIASISAYSSLTPASIGDRSPRGLGGPPPPPPTPGGGTPGSHQLPVGNATVVLFLFAILYGITNLCRRRKRQ